MDTETLPDLRKILRLALVAFGIASAWILLSLVLGLGSSDARADDGADDASLGGLLSSVVDDASGGVTDAATQAVGAVNTVVATTVTNAPLPEPVASVVSPVADTASSAVTAVSEAASNAASAGIVAPVVDAVSAVAVATPVVGDVVTTLGLDDALGAAGQSLDKTVAQVADSLVGTGSAIDPPTGSMSPIPGVPTADEAAVAVTPWHALEAAALDSDAAWSLGARAVPAAGESTSALPPSPLAAASRIAATLAVGAFFPLGMSLSADSAFAGPGGSGPGAWGLLAFGPLVAYRAWVRRRGPDDERAPAAPLYATDVSPD